MHEAMAEWMGFPMYFAAAGGASPPVPAGAGHATVCPYGPNGTADGAILFGLQNDRESADSCRVVLARDDLAEDPRFHGNSGRAAQRDAGEATIVATFAALTTEAAQARLEAARIGTARVNDMAGLWAHPQLEARDRWRQVAIPGGEITALRPVAGRGWEARMDAVPDLGAHTEAILAEFGVAATVAGGAGHER